MVSSIGSIGSAASLMMPQYQPVKSLSEVTGFEEMVQSIKDRVGESQPVSFDEVQPIEPIQSSSASSTNSSSSSQQANDAADLNKDGTVTPEEAIKYMQMQMMEKMSEDMMSMADENSQSSQQNTGENNKPDPKMRQAAGAYSTVQNSLNAYEGTSIFA